MTELKGRFFYTGWLNRPWRLVDEEAKEHKEIDLHPLIADALIKWDGQRMSHENSHNGYSLWLDPKSEYNLVNGEDDFVILDKPAQFGFSNVVAYMETGFHFANGRLVIVTIDDDGFQIEADPAEEVLGLYFTHDNSCDVPAAAEHSVCKAGTRDCCIFLTMGPSGFQCEKFSSGTARHLLDRYAKGEMNATRIGNCKLLGRAE